PVDITGQVTSEIDLLEVAADAMLDVGGYGSLVIFLAAAGLGPAMQEIQKKLARDIRRKYPGRLVIFSTLADPQQQRALEQLGCLTFTDPSRAIRVLAAMNFFRAQRAQPARPAPAGRRVLLRPGLYNEADALEL